MKGKKLGDFEWKNVMADGMQLAEDSGILGPIELGLLHLSLCPWMIDCVRMKEDTLKRTGGKCGGQHQFSQNGSILGYMDLVQEFHKLRQKLEI